MTKPVLFGADYSVYTRIVLMMFYIKNIKINFVNIDIFDDNSVPKSYSGLHPFHKIPSLQLGGFQLYETGAICRFVDEKYPKPPLQPHKPETRARMNQMLSILDNYAYSWWVRDIYVATMESDNQPTAEQLSDAVAKGKKCATALETLMENSPCLVGDTVSLADIYAVPMITYLTRSPAGQSLLDEAPALNKWWDTIQDHRWVTETAPPLDNEAVQS